MHGCKAQLHHPTCHMRRRMHAWARMSYEEEDACMGARLSSITPPAI
jgi:hypothetical protein